MLSMQFNSYPFQNHGISVGQCSIHHQPAKIVTGADSKSYYFCDICFMLYQNELNLQQSKVNIQQNNSISAQYQTQGLDIIDQFRKQIQMELLNSNERKEDIIESVKEKAGLLQNQSLKGIDTSELQNYDLNQLRNQFLNESHLFQSQQQLSQMLQKQFSQKQPIVKQSNSIEVNQITKANTAFNSLNINCFSQDQQDQHLVLYAQVKEIQKQHIPSCQNQIQILSNTCPLLSNNQGVNSVNFNQNMAQLMQKQIQEVSNQVITNSNNNLLENNHSNQLSSLINQQFDRNSFIYTHGSSIPEYQNIQNTKSTIQQKDAQQIQIEFNSQRINILQKNQINQNQSQTSLISQQIFQKSNSSPLENHTYHSQILVEHQQIQPQESKVKPATAEQSQLKNQTINQMISEQDLTQRETLTMRRKDFIQDISLDIQKINQNTKGNMEEENSLSVTQSFSILSNEKSDKTISSSPFPVQKKIKKDKPEKDIQKEFLIKSLETKKKQKSKTALSQISSTHNMESAIEENGLSCGKSVSSNFFQYGNNLVNVLNGTKISSIGDTTQDQTDTTSTNPAETPKKIVNNQTSPLIQKSQNFIQQLQNSQSEVSTDCLLVKEKFYFIQQNQVLFQNFNSNQLYQVELSVRKNESNKLKIIKTGIKQDMHVVPINELIFAIVQQTQVDQFLAFKIDSFELSNPEKPFKTSIAKTQLTAESFKMIGIESVTTAGKLIFIGKSSIIFYDLFTEKCELKSIDTGNGQKQEIAKIKYVQLYPRHSVVVMTKQKYFFIFDITKNYKLTIQKIAKEDILINQDQIIDFWYYEDKRFCCDSKNIYEILKQDSLKSPTNNSQQKIQLLSLNLKIKNVKFFQGSSFNGLPILINNEIKYFRFHDKNLINVPQIQSADKNQFLFEINNQIYKCSH